MISVVCAHERAVVLRFGRVARLRGPGLMAFLPGVERVVRFSLRERTLAPLMTRALTRDDLSVWLTASATCCVTDPARWAVAVSDVYVRTADDAIESALRAEVARTDLMDLAHHQTHASQRLLASANATTAAWGVAVRTIEVATVELQLTPEFLHWARHLRERHRSEA